VVAGILHPIMHSVVARPLDVEGAALRIRSLLLDREEFIWTEALGRHPTIADVLSLLLALLELARHGQCFLTQSAAFSPLVIRRDSTLPAH